MSLLHHNCRFLLFVCCFFLLFLCAHLAENGQGKSHRRPIRPQHQKERQIRRPRDFRMECVTGYRERIEFHCQFPGMDKPCLRENAKDSAHQLDALASECCASDGLCSVDDIEALCCRTMDCLALCYGQSFLDRIQNRFRYADILLKRHSSNKDTEKEGQKTKKEEDEKDDK